jgi:hypothetical protein
MKKEWDPNESQGKRKDQVQTAYRIVAGCIVISILVTSWVLFYELIKIIF